MSDRAAFPLQALDAFSALVSHATDWNDLLTVTLSTLSRFFGYTHSMLLLADETGDGLFVVASEGYEQSGAGAELLLGEGVIGIAAQRLQTIRLASLAGGPANAPTHLEIALPALEAARSQIAIPTVDAGGLLGVLFLESEQPGRFDESDEAALNVAARVLSLTMALLRSRSSALPLITAAAGSNQLISGLTIVIKHYATDDSIFIANDFLIKGVTGGLFWRLLSSFADERSIDLSQSRVGVASSLDWTDRRLNVEARLVMLRRRLADCCDFLRLESTGGRFHLVVDREITLLEIPK